MPPPLKDVPPRLIEPRELAARSMLELREPL
jgi:hypothetical protein